MLNIHCRIAFVLSFLSLACPESMRITLDERLPPPGAEKSKYQAWGKSSIWAANLCVTSALKLAFSSICFTISSSVDPSSAVISARMVSSNRRLVSSVGWVPDCRAGGRGFESWPDQHSGS